MSPSFWSDENQLFVPRLLGWSINFKVIAKRLGWIKAEIDPPESDGCVLREAPSESSREERLRRAIEDSRSEKRSTRSRLPAACRIFLVGWVAFS